MQHQASLQEKIRQLASKKNAVILAHYYQEPAIQEIADFTGDSLGLSQQAASTNADIIVFAGVHFMAETAKILNPSRKVLLPDLMAGCSLADSCPPDKFRTFLDQHPGHTVISYINCSAEIKAMSDWICTSANAVDVVNAIPYSQPLIFAPDRHLGEYVSSQAGRDMVLWNGACTVHEAFSLEKINALRALHADALLVVHPESVKELVAQSDFTGSTTAMINFISRSEARTFIVATEAGILHKLRQAAPDKLLIPAPVPEDNACACSECPYMKMNTLEKLYRCLLTEGPEISLPEELRMRALKPLERMLSLSSTKEPALSMRC